MTFRDTSADITLDNANMSDFEKWFAGEHGVPQNCHLFARSAYQFRQPEIDALKEELSKWVSIGQTRLEEVAGLKAERTKLKAENDRARKAYLEYEQENFLLKAENERLQTENSTITERNHELWLKCQDTLVEVMQLRKDAEWFAVLLKAFMFSEVQSREELDAGKALIKKYAAMKDFSTT